LVAFATVLFAQSVARADDDPKVSKWGIGVRVRDVFMPTAVLNLFLDHSTPMNQAGFGGEIVRRKGDFDVVIALEYDSIQPSNGLYLKSGNNPSNCVPGDTCPDFVTFKNFALLSGDVSFIWHYKITDLIQLRYGAGIGIGAVLGELDKTHTSCGGGTTVGQLDNPNACMQTGGAIKSTDVPPVVPIVNVQLGARIKINKQLSVNVEMGFRDVFFAGLGTDYVF
jgi:hypothetical protein